MIANMLIPPPESELEPPWVDPVVDEVVVVDPVPVLPEPPVLVPLPKGFEVVVPPVVELLEMHFIPDSV